MKQPRGIDTRSRSRTHSTARTPTHAHIDAVGSACARICRLAQTHPAAGGGEGCTRGGADKARNFKLAI
eukprot:6190103-Pleurochrysis_carterae.AAC.1